MARKRGCYRRRQEVRAAKKIRYEQKELQRLKKTLGIIDAEGDEMMKDVSNLVTVKTAKDLKLEQKSREEQEALLELEEVKEKEETITVVNEKTGKTHKYNSKTLVDQYGTYPPWFKRRNMAKRLRKKEHAKMRDFKQTWTVVNVKL